MLKDKITEDLKKAMKDRDTLRIRVIRSIKDALHKAEIDNLNSYTEVLEGKVIKKMISSHKDSIEQFVGRPDLIANEEAEMAIIQEYAPKEVDTIEIIDYITKYIKQYIVEHNGVSMKDMKPILSHVQSVYPSADGKVVAPVLKQFING